MGMNRINWEIRYKGRVYHYQGGVLVETREQEQTRWPWMRYHFGAEKVDTHCPFSDAELFAMAGALDDEHLLAIIGSLSPIGTVWVRGLPREVREREMMPALRDWSKRQKGAK